MSLYRHLSSPRFVFFIVILVIFASLGVFSLDKKHLSPGNDLYASLIASNSLNNELIRKIEFSVPMLVRHTRYQGRMRYNMPPRKGYLSIVFYNYNKSIPRYGKYQCFSLPTEEIIFCDARFLDAFPDAMPIQVEKGDSPAPNFLLLWAVGHEIGHVVLRHSRPGSIDLSEGILSRLWTGLTARQRTVPLKSLGELVSLGNAQENEADQFAIGQLQLNPTRGLQMALAITDAALWFEGQYKHAAPKTPILHIVRTSHPPFLMRILHLSQIMKSLYTDYKQLDYIDDDKIDFNLKFLEPDVAPDPELIFGGYYRHIRDQALSKTEIEDLALYAFFASDESDFDAIRRAFCSKNQTDGPFCGPAAKTPPGVPADCGSSTDKSLQQCVRDKVIADIQCFKPAHLMSANHCDARYLRAALERLPGTKFTDPNFEWTTLAHAEIFIHNLISKKDESIDFDTYFDFLAKSKAGLIQQRFLQRFIAEYDVVHSDDPEHLARLHILGRHVAENLGDRTDAIAEGSLAMSLFDHVSGPAENALRASARTELARLYLNSKDDVPAKSLSEYQADVNKAIPLFKEALKYRKNDLQIATLGDVGTRRVAGEQLLVAMNDVIVSLTRAGECNTALPFADQAQAIVDRLDRDERMMALTYENIAAANVCARSGAGQTASDVARRAVAVRERHIGDKDGRTRLLIAYFTLWSAAQKMGDVPTCKTAANKFKTLYEGTTGRYLVPSIGTIIDGKIVEMRDCIDSSR